MISTATPPSLTSSHPRRSHPQTTTTLTLPTTTRITNTTTTSNNTVTLPTTPLPSTASSSRPQRRVTVTWQKDGENVRRSGDDYRVRRRTGRLHFFHVRYSDRGNYRCIVQSNGVKIHSSYAKLVVHGKGPFTPGIY